MRLIKSDARCLFQSTPSVGRATDLRHCYRYPCGISIHALRGEGDVIDND